jgi:hypothetical protein
MVKSTEKHILHTCEKCNFSCERKPDWTRHLSTAKHAKSINVNNEIMTFTPNHICSKCCKEYKSYVGLWKHKKTCNNENITMPISEHVVGQNDSSIDTIIHNNEEFKKLILELVKTNNELQIQNNDLHKRMVEMCTINNSTINSHNNNKTFNLQFFLNEQCKDSMNISDFANSITLELSDLESVGELGYVEGITKVVLDKLNSMDIYK